MSEYIERGALEAKAVYMHGFGENKYVPLNAIQQATAADVVEVKHGHWKWNIDRTKPFCSECAEEPWRKNNIELPNYCHNCGAKMDGE